MTLVAGVVGIWRGTDSERAELLYALDQNCACTYDGHGARTSTCGAHGLLTADQSTLDHLLFGRRMRGRLNAEEGITQP